MHAGNGSSSPKDPMQEIAAIQYNTVKGVRQLRTDFTDNRKFVELLLQASDEVVSFTKSHKDWRPAVKAYHAAFEELKRCLQGEWKRVFGDGPSRFPWNGYSDGATDLWREDDLRRDIPVVLSLWGSGISGHICRTEVCYKSDFTGRLEFRVPNDNKAYVPKNSSANQTVINKGKDVYKAYVLEFFNASKLSKCKKYLKKFFCAPVSNLLMLVSNFEAKGGVDCREDLKLMLSLYADYYSLDAVAVDNNRTHNGEEFCCVKFGSLPLIEEFGSTTLHMVRLMVQCYSNYEQWNSEDRKWLCSLLDDLDANYYMKENLHTYCIQSHHLLRGYKHTKFTGISGMSFSKKTSSCEGLAEAFEKLGHNPLPKETWLKFVNYAGRRISLVRETKSWGEQPKGFVERPPCGPNDANTVLHRSKTFDQIPCNEPEGGVGKIAWQGEAKGIKP